MAAEISSGDPFVYWSDTAGCSFCYRDLGSLIAGVGQWHILEWEEYILVVRHMVRTLSQIQLWLKKECTS